MTELINISTNAQGASVVSAYEVYTFLQLGTNNWVRWTKKNITGNQWAKQGEDWDRLLIMRNGNQTTDYMLTLDFAKRLAMLARTDKGEKIRRYFIDCEKKLRQVDTQTLHTLANQQRQIEQLQAEVQIISNRLSSLPTKSSANNAKPSQWNTYTQRGEIMPPASQNQPNLPFYPALIPPRSSYNGCSGGQKAVAAIPAEVIMRVINLAYQDGLPRHYAELRVALTDAAPQIGWPLSKHRIETLIRRCVAEGYLIRFRPEGYTHPFYQPAKSSPPFRR